MANDEKKIEHKRRVFQVVDGDPPRQLVTLQRTPYSSNGVNYPGITRVIDMDNYGCFVLRAKAEYYEDQYKALQLAAERLDNCVMVEKDNPKGIVPKFLKKEKSDKELLREAQLKIDENGQGWEELKKVDKEKDEEIADLKARLAKAKDKGKK